MQNSRQK